jgi:hypothetical protein
MKMIEMSKDQNSNKLNCCNLCLEIFFSAKVMGQNSFGPKTSLNITAPLYCVGDTIYGQNGAFTYPGDGSPLHHCPAGYRYAR